MLTSFLSGEYKVWQTYETEKRDTQEVLHQAEVQLKALEQGVVPSEETNVKVVAEDKLKTLQELKVNLRPSVQPEVSRKGILCSRIGRKILDDFLSSFFLFRKNRQKKG